MTPRDALPREGVPEPDIAGILGLRQEELDALDRVAGDESRVGWLQQVARKAIYEQATCGATAALILSNEEADPVRTWNRNELGEPRRDALRVRCDYAKHETGRHRADMHVTDELGNRRALTVQWTKEIP